MEHFEIHINERKVKMEGFTQDLLRGLAIAAANIIRNKTKPGAYIERATNTFCELVRFEVQTGSVAPVEVDVGTLEQALQRMQNEKGGEAE